MEVVDGMRECFVYMNDGVFKWIVWMVVLYFLKGDIIKILKLVKLILVIIKLESGNFLFILKFGLVWLSNNIV